MKPSLPILLAVISVTTSTACRPRRTQPPASQVLESPADQIPDLQGRNYSQRNAFYLKTIESMKLPCSASEANLVRRLIQDAGKVPERPLSLELWHDASTDVETIHSAFAPHADLPFNGLSIFAAKYRLRFRDLNFLNCFPDLVSLSLTGIDSDTFTAVSNLRQLRELRISASNLKTVDGLGNLTKLRKLSLFSTEIDSLQDLMPLNRLKDVEVGQNPKLRDIFVVKWLHGLERIALQGNSVRDIGALSGLKNLKVIFAPLNEILSLANLKDLPALEQLYVQNNCIDADGWPDLKEFPKLDSLFIQENVLRSLPSGFASNSLTQLHAYANFVSDFTPLTTWNLPKLSFLVLDSKAYPLPANLQQRSQAPYSPDRELGIANEMSAREQKCRALKAN